MTLTYQTSNTDLQSIDSFDLPTSHSIDYKIHISTPIDNQVSYMSVSHNGVVTGDTLNSFVQSNTIPLDITSSIVNYVGKINVTPIDANTTFTIEKTITECNLYSESTVSGKLIRHTEGFGFDYETSVSVTVRQEDNNYYGDANAFYVANTFGYVATENELLIGPWISNNGSDLSGYVAISSGQVNNYQYQEIVGEYGYCYRLSANAFYEIADEVIVKENYQRAQGQCFVRVGKTPGSAEYINRNLNTTEEVLDLLFTPDSDTFYVSYGFGDRSNRAHLIGPSLKKAVPFHTWNKDSGTIYIKWEDMLTNAVLLEISSQNNINISITSDSSDNMIISQGDVTVNAGPQIAVNQICFNESGISLNGNSVVSHTLDYKFISKFEFINYPLTFSYVPIALTNAEMIDLTNG